MARVEAELVGVIPYSVRTADGDHTTNEAPPQTDEVYQLARVV
jgi:hypothetical protein